MSWAFSFGDFRVWHLFSKVFETAILAGLKLNALAHLLDKKAH